MGWGGGVEHYFTYSGMDYMKRYSGEPTIVSVT